MNEKIRRTKKSSIGFSLNYKKVELKFLEDFQKEKQIKLR